MKKDVIYIDIEDDITSVIEKLKNSNEKIVAMVPPKGNAVLQSVVNLKLLKRAADQAGKQPVVVTSNQALTALAGGLDFYVAKNLQSKPVLAGAAAAELLDDEDVEVSDHSEVEEASNTPDTTDDDSDEVELTGDELAGLQAGDAAGAGAVAAAGKKSKDKKDKKDKKKVPNFDSFRKKLLIGGGIALLLLIVGLFVFGRSKATIVLRAETTPVDVAFNANLNTASQTSDPSTFNLKAISKESKKTITQSFSATGQKDLGTKATGSITIVNCSASDVSFAAGTGFSANGLTFVSQSAVSVPQSGYKLTGSGFVCKNDGNAKVSVASESAGDKYNLSARSYQISGGPSNVSASGTAMSGGTTNVVKVVTQADVDKAKVAITQQDTNQVKSDLKKSFPPDTLVLDDSFATTFGTVTSEPGVGEQANEGKVTAEVTYSIMGVPKSDMGAALDAFVTTKMTNKDQQRVYDNGINSLKLEKVEANDKTAVYKVSTAAQYGPQFNTDELKNEVKGKKFGEARSYLQGLPGVKGVDISLTPFWARTLPGVNRINIKLDVDKNALSQ